jgi:hypothetical protein
LAQLKQLQLVLEELAESAVLQALEIQAGPELVPHLEL